MYDAALVRFAVFQPKHRIGSRIAQKLVHYALHFGMNCRVLLVRMIQTVGYILRDSNHDVQLLDPREEHT
jgi:hypothetical protein